MPICATPTDNVHASPNPRPFLAPALPPEALLLETRLGGMDGNTLAKVAWSYATVSRRY